MGQYDVYFPGKVMPMWLFMILVICTFGMYYVFYQVKIYCMSRGCCLSKNIEFTRGRIMVTSHGRILVWSGVAPRHPVQPHAEIITPAYLMASEVVRQPL